ncbi:MAG TPA: phosphatidate cytidylyltransferase [Rhizomicrobium sp.]|jgi:phosphatidate cytidylyltransferase|nr:phosphatidate cytidylyltransferase [Rhizomicrobium sp.]
MNLAETGERYEWPARAIFGALLAATALASAVVGGYVFAAFVALVTGFAAREWHRMFSGSRYALPIAATAGSIVLALASAIALPGTLWPVWILVIGAMAAALSAWAFGSPALWNGFGTLYLGLPALALVLLRTGLERGLAAAFVVFVAIWASDTAALIGGRLLRGPKLIPTLSPNKTWAGFVVGSLAAAVGVGVYVALVGGRPVEGALIGFGLALAGHAGDLFESWVKRRVGRKHSGGLIPGHGGVLDRIDSILFAAPLAAFGVFVLGLDPLCGGHP